MYFRHVQQLLRRLTLIPIFITSLVLALALSIFYYRETEAQTQEQFYNIAAIAAEISAPALVEGNINTINETLTALMQHKQVKGVRLLDNKRTVIGHQGMRYLDKTLASNWLSGSLKKSVDPQSGLLRLSHPIFSNANGEVIGWVDIAFDTTSAQFSHMDMLMGVLIIGLLLPAIVSIFLLERVNRMRPDIQAIEDGIQAIANGDYNHAVQVTSLEPLTAIAKDLNQVAYSVQEAQTELKRNIEHNIDELRETMETIEIQNIELDMARKRAIEASRVKSEFLANASHEFRTPLNGIIGFTQLLLKADISETQQEFLRTIETSAQGLLTIINDILDISHIEAGSVNLDYIPMRLETVVEETLQILAPTAFQSQCELVAMMEPDLPQELVSDPLRIKQILTNLINNAIKFSAEPNIVLRVCRDHSGTVQPKSAKSIIYRFEISGIGNDIQIDTDQLLKDFSNLESGATRSLGDNGLGLAISKGLVKALGGSLGFESKENSQLLWFAIPLDQGQKSKPYVEKALTGLNVVICCGNETIMEQLRQLTANWKLNIVELANPMEILPSMQKLSQMGKFQQLLIMDVAVIESKATATSFLDQLTYQLNSDYNCKTLLLTTPSKQRELIEAELNRAVAFSSKPLVRDRIYKSICTHLNIYKQLYRPSKTQLLKNPGHKPKVLAVDDNPANLMLVREFLVNLGAEAVTAASAADAIKECETETFDLIFMDIQMPDMDGIEATREIRKRAPAGVRVPVVALTAHAVNDRKSELLLAGLDDYLSKPITEEQLAHVIQRWCNHTGVALQKPEPKTEFKPEIKPLAPPMVDVTELLSSEMVTKPVDIQQCLRLAGNKPDLARDMLAMLIESLPETLDDIDRAVQDKNMDELESVVHKLRGGARCTGTPNLADVSSRLDSSLFHKEYDNVYTLLSQVTDAIETLLRWNEEYDLDSMFEVEA
ncbi:response regulator [Halioxenophilus sp. WMMB6]|uniref:response regulator n=1 Tax=Halioxenophilus sp. WMMB6 TaxID=3073815 RepID=UPI00295EBB17|nr:response regulator [Halioxenophilus sp. WMMB6]